MEAQAFTRATVRRPHYDDGLQDMQTTSSGMERVPLELSNNEQLPQFAPGSEGLEIAYAEVASTPRQKAVVHSVQGAKNVKAALLKRVQIKCCAVFSILAVIIIIVAVVVTLKTRSHAQSMSGSHHEVTTNTISRPTSGAHNGTGMTALTPMGNPSPYAVVLYYQYCTGAIRTARLPFEGMWQPYDYTQDLLIPSGARIGTPLANAACGSGDNIWQLFYVDSSNNLRDTLRTGASAVWGPGLLSNTNIQVSNATSTGLAVNCNNYSNQQSKDPSLVVFYGGTDGLVHEITWHKGNSSWTDGFTFPGTNGNAGIDTQSFNSTLSVILVNSIGCLEVWWKDYNRADYAWIRSFTSSESMQPNTSVANDWEGRIYAQYANNSFASAATGAMNSVITMTSLTPMEGIDGIPESRITQLTAMLDEGRAIRTIFVQVNGSDITQVQQLTPGGPWYQAAIPLD